MSMLTKGPITFTPVTLRVEASLDEILAAMVEHGARKGLMDGGWGSISDNPSYVGKNGVLALDPGSPEIYEREDDWTPRRIMARFYWRYVDKDLLAELGDAEWERTMRLAAADVVVTESHVDGEYLVLMGVRLIRELNRYLIPAVQALGAVADTRYQVTSNSSPLSFGDDDFFRWLTYRWVKNPAITSDLVLQGIRNVDAQDLSDRGTSLKRGIALDRPEYLALLMTPTVRLGPAKFVIASPRLGLSLDVEVRVDGGFSIQVGESDYDEPADRPVKGLFLFKDTAFYVLPELRRAFNEDEQWRVLHRNESIEEARDLMRAALQVVASAHTCVHCGRNPAGD